MRDGTRQPRSSALNGKAPARPTLRRSVGEPRLASVQLATGGTATFAESILARYSGRSLQRFRPNLVYQRPGPWWIIQRVLHRSSPQLSLRLALHFTEHPVVDRGRSVSVRSDQPGGRAPAPPLILVTSGIAPASADPSHASALPAVVSVSPMRLPATRSAPLETAYRRGTSRQIREVYPPARTAPLALAFDPGMPRRMAVRERRLPMEHPAGRPALSSPAARPVARVVQRPQAVPEPAQAGRRATPFGGDEFTSGEFPGGIAPFSSSRTPGWPGTDTTSITPAGLAPHQVQRLADQVVQIIDDRIIARRERVGRV